MFSYKFFCNILFFVFFYFNLIEADNSGVVDSFNNDLFEIITMSPIYNKWIPPQKESKFFLIVFVFFNKSILMSFFI